MTTIRRPAVLQLSDSDDQVGHSAYVRRKATTMLPSAAYRANPFYALQMSVRGIAQYSSCIVAGTFLRTNADSGLNHLQSPTICFSAFRQNVRVDPDDGEASLIEYVSGDERTQIPSGDGGSESQLTLMEDKKREEDGCWTAVSSLSRSLNFLHFNTMSGMQALVSRSSSSATKSKITLSSAETSLTSSLLAIADLTDLSHGLESPLSCVGVTFAFGWSFFAGERLDESEEAFLTRGGMRLSRGSI